MAEDVRGRTGTGLPLTDSVSLANAAAPEALQAAAPEAPPRSPAAARLRVLSEAAAGLMAACDPLRVVDQLCRRMMVFLDCQVFLHHLIDPGTNRLQLNAFAGIADEDARRLEWLDVGEAICGSVARDGRRIVAERIPQRPDEAMRRVARLGVQACACHPILAGTQVLGTLLFGSRTRETFPAEDLELMKAVTDLVAIAVGRRRSERALRDSEECLRRLNEELEHLVRERTNELARTVEQLRAEGARRSLAERVLRERSQLLEGFFRHTLTPLAFLTPDFRFIRVNEAYARADGMRPEDFVGRDHFDLYPSVENREIFERVVHTRQPYETQAKPFEYADHPERGVTYWNWILTPVLDEQGQVQCLVLNLEDVTDRQRAMQELERKARQMRDLAMHASRAEERERRRLATLLHDDLQQVLVGAKLHLGILRPRVKKDRKLQRIVEHVSALLREAVEKARGLSHELSPPVLHQAGLPEALAWLGQQMADRCGLPITVSAAPEAVMASEAASTFLFRAAQELLLNVAKHADAPGAAVRLEREGDVVRLMVADEGRGFDPDRPDDRGGPAGMGLVRLRERVQLLGGAMTIDSAPGRGSRFVLTVPDAVARPAAPVAEPREVVEAAAQGPRRSDGDPLRVLLVDDHRILREGLAGLLGEQPDLSVVGQAGGGLEAIELAGRLAPDVVIMDVAMPGMDGVEATRRLKARWPDLRVIGLSMFAENEMGKRMLLAGADRYLSKAGSPEALLAAVRGA